MLNVGPQRGGQVHLYANYAFVHFRLVIKSLTNYSEINYIKINIFIFKEAQLYFIFKNFYRDFIFTNHIGFFSMVVLERPISVLSLVV